MRLKSRTSIVSLALVALLMLVAVGSALAKGSQLSPKAPKDKNPSINKNEVHKFDAAIAPYVKKARATLPQAKKRYLEGLPQGEIFFVTTRLSEQNGKESREEQILVRVKSWKAAKIMGTIASNMEKVKSYKFDDVITLDEKDVSDWLIAKPDGSEEGNYVGKFLDTYRTD